MGASQKRGHTMPKAAGFGNQKFGAPRGDSPPPRALIF